MEKRLKSVVERLPGDRPAAIVTYMSYSGLGAVRDLARAGIPVISVDADPHSVGMNSRYCRSLVSPDVVRDEEGFLRFFSKLGEALPAGAVLYPTGDDTVLFFLRHWDELSNWYIWEHASGDQTRRLVGKIGMAELADQHGLPAPRSMRLSSTEQAQYAATEIPYPAVIKPDLSTDWRRAGDALGVKKVVPVESASELLEAYEKLSPYSTEMVVQEMIPGEDDDLYYACFYVDEHGNVPGLFMGRKIRLFPIQYGSASFVESMEVPEMRDVVLPFLTAAGYRGLGGMEFKKDSRDGIFKLIELNARYGLWDTLGTRCGVNLAVMAYEGALGKAVQPVHGHRSGVKWMALGRDFAAFRLYRRLGMLTPGAWLGSLRGEVQGAVFDVRDPMPSVSTSIQFLGELRDSLLRRIRRRE